MCSNVYYDVKDFEVSAFTKNTKISTLENKKIILQIKKIIIHYGL